MTRWIILFMIVQICAVVADLLKSPKAMQKAAVSAWVNKLTPRDYNATVWSQMYAIKRPQDVFAHYAKMLSDTFKEHSAVVNFVLCGACDGTHDKTISELYLPNYHWRGLFIEPIAVNFHDLQLFLIHHNVSSRSFAIHAAVTNQCNSPTVVLRTVNTASKNVNLTRWSHWRSREKGAIVDVNATTGTTSFLLLHPSQTPLTSLLVPGQPILPMENDIWKAENSRCIVAPDALDEWTTATSLKRMKKIKKVQTKNKGKENRKTKQSSIIRRPHVLKIDTEGQDLAIISSLLPNGAHRRNKPILINFEVKVLSKEKYSTLRTLLEKHGYVVSAYIRNVENGFAMLRPEYTIKTRQ